MQIRNTNLCEASKRRVCTLKRSKPPLVDEHAFSTTGFVVAWLGCSLCTVVNGVKSDLAPVVSLVVLLVN